MSSNKLEPLNEQTGQDKHQMGERRYLKISHICSLGPVVVSEFAFEDMVIVMVMVIIESQDKHQMSTGASRFLLIAHSEQWPCQNLL